MEDSGKVQVRLSKLEREQLDELLRGGLQPVRTVLRALVLRQLADGQTIRKVARNVGLTPKTVWLTSQRYQQGGLDRALYERARPGKEARLDTQQRQRIVALVCSPPPDRVLVGEPATATAVASNFNPNHALNYTWSSTGGQIAGKDSTASVNTRGMAGGSYTVTAHISDPKMRKGGEASCMAILTVKELPKNPPQISCSASPSTVQAGTSATISCTCTSPDNVPVTVGGWTASGGSVSASGDNTAVLNTSGASPGPITVSASCTDPRGLNTPATAQVLVENPPPSPDFLRLESRLALHSIYFPTDQPRITNPDGGLLESQQQTLISLADDFKKYVTENHR